jgi:hypothetical protein
VNLRLLMKLINVMTVLVLEMDRTRGCTRRIWRIVMITGIVVVIVIHPLVVMPTGG